MSQRGHQRERAVRDLLRSEDWFVVRAAGSLGDADLLALRAGSRPRLIEVKSSAASPYAHFLPADRYRLSQAAKLAGAEAWLAYWPPRGKLRWIPESEWPEVRLREAREAA